MRIECRHTDGIGWVTIHPDRESPAAAELSAAAAELRRFMDMPDLRGVVLAGTAQHFWPCAPSPHDDAARDAAGTPEALRDWLDALAFAPLPTVAALRGTCRGIGVATALCCHFRIAAIRARLDFAPHARLNPWPAAPWACLAQWQAQLAPLCAAARTVAAQEARAMGLVDSVVRSPAIADEARALISALTLDRSPAQIRSILRAVHGGRTLTMDAALRLETELFCQLALQGARGETRSAAQGRA